MPLPDRRGRCLVASAILLILSCNRGEVSREGRPPAAASSVTASAAISSPVLVAGATPWAPLVRDAEWDAAWRALEALSEAQKSRPEVRYVRARVALARGDAGAAVSLLDGLESALPLLADSVERYRAEGKLVAGPFAESGEWFEARPSPSSQLDAARAFEKAKDPRRARAAADRVVASARRTREEEAEARALRVRLAEPASPADAVDSLRADALWLATTGADLAPGADAPALVAKLDPKRPMTAAEWMLRVGVLSVAGRLDEALRSLDLARKAPGADKITRVERRRARAMALYHARGHFGEAATILSECANAGGPQAADDAFYAARALSRADRDEEAIRGYRGVQRRFPKSKVADQAAFLEPYLWMLHGDWPRCSQGFATYLRERPAGDEVRNTRRDGALCDLLRGDTKPARASYEHLVEDEPDPIVSARMEDMAALAALRDGDRTHAVARWTDVARSRPLSWPALVARARLGDVGAPVPPSIDPAAALVGPDPPPMVVTLPPPAGLLHALGLEVDAEAALREREGAVTMGAGPRAPEALCEAYGELGRARRRYQIAQSLPSSLFTSAPTLRTRWAWDCAFPSPYGSAVTAAESVEKLPRGLLWAVMRQESAFDPDAISPARAVGLMQIMPETARPIAQELSLSPDDARLTSPPYAIRVAGRLLRDLLDRFHGDVPLAVAAYNAGADAVERWAQRAPGMQIDTFVERIPYQETRDYVARVMGNLARYAYLAGGEAAVPSVDLALPGR